MRPDRVRALLMLYLRRLVEGGYFLALTENNSLGPREEASEADARRFLIYEFFYRLASMLYGEIVDRLFLDRIGP